MEQRLSLITLGVADLQRSKAFYEELGWKPVNTKSHGIVFFQTGAMAFALYPRIDLAKDANVSPDGHGFGGITLAYNARTRDEVDSVLVQAEAAGAKVLKRAQRPSGADTTGIFLTRMDFCGRSRGIHSSPLRKMGPSEFLPRVNPLFRQ